MYMALKHSHMLFIALSVTFLAVRFLLSLKSPALLQNKFLKIAPHVVDTLLLLTAIGLMLTIQQYPFQTPWLTDKLFGLFAYIGLAVMALKGRSLLMRWVGFLGALSWLALVGKVAITKTPVLFG
ncbi:MAG: SirB2 family protein [Gammaproteobacteria bacterium]|nr:SirB2 family protein [Gammaproteobacteria bacterium]MBU2058176.1 SirB2 family protein [Gammaproteobacteria bacterium]MBU2176911.1 SirB2 family protein [Gammaproteobacteria bacterium]MBU2246048.1 SirB2 family protein [Gammaproteobacteria bacterium]MBU2344119.1 SirB2 family protein [Gammaproteobacteria bacterium]